MRLSCLSSPLRTIFFATICYLVAPASAQAQSPYLYASIPGATGSQVAAYSVALDGTLTPVQGSPFSISGEGGLVTTDPTDQFLFVLNPASNTISVLSIDSTGELTPVGSPVPAPTPPPGSTSAFSKPTSMATLAGEGGNPSYLFVAYRNGPSPFTGAIVAYQIGGSSPPLTAVSTISLDATPIDIAVSPQGFIYPALQLIPNSNRSNPMPGVGILKIDSFSKQLEFLNFANNNPNETAVLLNRDATFLFDAEGSRTAGVGQVESAQIRSDGSTEAPQSLVLSSPNVPPSALLIDGSGQLLYVQQGDQIAVYAIDQTRGTLSTPSISAAPPPFTLGHGNAVTHPVASYLYTLQNGAQIHVFEITDSTSGALRELSDPPYTVAGASGAAGLTLTHNAASQTGAAASLLPRAINFSQTTVGQSVSDSSALLTNNGTEVLNVSVSIITADQNSITGADQNDFSASPCPSSLAARTSCPITVTFKPTQAGTRQATLVVTDAAGPQTLQLTGTGVATQPAVGFVPFTLTFAATNTGGVSTSQSVVLTNSGNANLHISSILVNGQNSADFHITNRPGSSDIPTACTTVAYAPNQSCSVTIVFTPTTAGARSASIIIDDDAPGSPQTVPLAGSGVAPGPGGTGNPPPVIALSTNSLLFTSSAINSTTTEQYVIVTNVGASGSSLSVTGVQLTGPNSSDFKVANGCNNWSSAQTNNCTLAVTFTPSDSGTRSANLVITDNAPSSPQSVVTLTGVTQPGTGAVTITAPNGFTQSISAGGTANYALSVLSNFGGTLMFSKCSGAPSTANCTVPQSIAFDANKSASFQISVATAAATSSNAFDRFIRREIAIPNIVRLCLAILCFLLLSLLRKPDECQSFPLTSSRSLRLASPFLASIAIVALLTASLLTIAGCGGASTVATAPAVTPTSQSQTYTITITPTVVPSDNVSVPTIAPIQLTLIVN